MQFQLHKNQEEVLEIITDTVTRARNLIDDVEWSAMDGPRTDRLPVPLCRSRHQCGATTINLPDTVGYATAGGIRQMFRRCMRKRVPGADKGSSRAHCHNDLGLAVANSLAVCRRRAPGRVHHQRPGRAGRQCALEEIVMAMRTRGDDPALRPGIDRDSSPAPPDGVGGHRLCRPVQQGHRRQAMPLPTRAASTRTAC
jgi:2-isopropylmalate synthase